MVELPLKKYAVEQEIAERNKLFPPKSSAAIMVQAKGVLEAAANTDTKQIAANKSIGEAVIVAYKFPEQAPIKKKGGTSTPLNPPLRLTEVKLILQSQLKGFAPPA